MIRKRVPAILIVLSICAAAAPLGSPDAVVEKFYAIKLSGSRDGGVPDAAFRAKLAPLLTPALLKAMEDAGAAEARHFTATRNEEPPLVEGDILSSMFEGPTSARVTSCADDKGIMTCKAALVYVDARDQAATNWTDSLLLEKTDTGWRIDDIVYGGTWAFGPKGKLTDLLNDVANDQP